MAEPTVSSTVSALCLPSRKGLREGWGSTSSLISCQKILPATAMERCFGSARIGGAQEMRAAARSGTMNCL